MSARDIEIGRVVQHWRGERSQQAIADEMRDRGHRWSQSTVWSVEKGDRPLKFTEAADLAEVCVKDVQDLSRDLPSTKLREAWRESVIHLGEAENHVFMALHKRRLVEVLLSEAPDLPAETLMEVRQLLDLDVSARLVGKVAEYEQRLSVGADSRG